MEVKRFGGRDGGRIAVAVWTRDLDSDEQFGRLKVARSIRQILRTSFAIHEVTLSLLKEKSWPRIISSSAFSILQGLIARKPIPFQCALFGSFGRRQIVQSLPAGTEFIYLDGVRTLLLMRMIRSERPHTKIICDLDDLMSRRMAFWQQTGAGIALGYLERIFPKALITILSGGMLSRAVMAYEKSALARTEQEILKLCDIVVLLSSVDAAELRSKSPSHAASKIVVIPPPCTVHRRPFKIAPPYRFVFVGSDKLLQNKLSIQFLLKLWEELTPSTELHIFGQQYNLPASLPSNVFSHGFVQSIADIYDENSILLAPSIIGGGVKTKVLEAFSFGAAVVGNSYTFEGMDMNYPLQIDDAAQLKSIINKPELYHQVFNDAAHVGQNYLISHLDAEVIASSWANVFASFNAPNGAREISSIPADVAPRA